MTLYITGEEECLRTVYAQYGKSLSFKKMKKYIPNRTAHEIRERVRKIFDGQQQTRQCAYGYSTPNRCPNTRGQAKALRITFQGVPNIPRVLQHMSITKYSENMICCSDHGQNPKQKLSWSNLASVVSTSSRLVSSKVASTPVKEKVITPRVGFFLS